MANLGILFLYWTCTETMRFQYIFSTVSVPLWHTSVYTDLASLWNGYVPIWVWNSIYQICTENRIQYIYDTYWFRPKLEQSCSIMMLNQYVLSLQYTECTLKLIHLQNVLIRTQIGTILFHNDAESVRTVTSVYTECTLKLIHLQNVLIRTQIGTILFHNDAESVRTVTLVYWMYTQINTFVKRTD